MFTFSFYLKPRPPFRLDLTVWALRRLPHNRIDSWNGSTYSRVLAVGGHTVKISVMQSGRHRIRIDITSEQEHAETALRPAIGLILEKMFGIRKDLHEFYIMAQKDKRIAPLVARFSGVKPPRFPTVFEAIINAVACQQLSLHVGIELLNRLAALCGRTWRGDEETLHAFPAPQDLADTNPDRLRSIGFSGSKAEVMIALSRGIEDGTMDPETLTAMDDAAALDFLLGLRGIGRWSAEYVMLRGLGRIHIFPGDDVGAQNNLKILFHLREKPDYGKIKKLMSTWHPYAGFLYFHFLLRKLETKGCL